MNVELSDSEIELVLGSILIASKGEPNGALRRIFEKTYQKIATQRDRDFIQREFGTYKELLEPDEIK